MTANSLATHAGFATAYRILGVTRVTWYRRRGSAPVRQQPRSRPTRALDETKGAYVLDVLGAERLIDRSPAEVVATLLDEGRYVCSERTMYCILSAEQPVRERRNQSTYPRYAKHELMASA